jgi:hypothetical protein
MPSHLNSDLVLLLRSLPGAHPALNPQLKQCQTNESPSIFIPPRFLLSGFSPLWWQHTALKLVQPPLVDFRLDGSSANSAACISFIQQV